MQKHKYSSESDQSEETAKPKRKYRLHCCQIQSTRVNPNHFVNKKFVRIAFNSDKPVIIQLDLMLGKKKKSSDYRKVRLKVGSD